MERPSADTIKIDSLIDMMYQRIQDNHNVEVKENVVEFRVDPKDVVELCK